MYTDLHVQKMYTHTGKAAAIKLTVCHDFAMVKPTLPPGKGDSAFPRISAQPLSEPLLNMHTTFYMSVITNALREVL